MAASAQVTISEFWPDHVMHKTVDATPRWDQELGVVCACGVVLGWPVEEPPEDAEPDWEPRHETLSQTLAREAQEKVSAARALADAAPKTGRSDYVKPITGAFGTYGGGPTVDRQLPDAIEDGDGEDVGYVPMPDERVDADGKSWGPPDSAEFVVGDRVTVAGIEFEKHSESPFPADQGKQEATPSTEVAPDDDHEKTAEDKGETTSKPFGRFDDEAQSAHPASGDLPPWEDDAPSNEGGVDTSTEWADKPGTEVEPYSPPMPGSGTPIYPTEAQELDPLVNRLAPLDPSLPYTPADVELKIVEILGQLEKSEVFLRQQLARLHAATHNYSMRYALVTAESDARAQDQRKAEATLACEHESYEMTEAEMLVRALRDSQHNLRSQLSGFQTVARSIGVSMGNTLGTSPKPSGGRPLPEPPPEEEYWR